MFIHVQQATEVQLTSFQQVRVIFPLMRDHSKGLGVVIAVTRPPFACTKNGFFQQKHAILSLQTDLTQCFRHKFYTNKTVEIPTTFYESLDILRRDEV